MKAKSLKYILATLPMLAFTACMDFDTPGDEFTGGQTVVDDQVYVGTPDIIDYRFTAANEEKAFEYYGDLVEKLTHVPTAQYTMRGSKDGLITSEHAYQYVYSLHIDNYSGYFTLSQNFNGKMPTCLSYYREYCDGPYGAIKSVRNEVCNLLNYPGVDNIPEVKAIALLTFDFSAAECVDTYGSIPYTDLKNNKQEAPFEFQPGSEIYKMIVNNIDSIDACFKYFETKPAWYRDFVEGMVLYDCDGITPDKKIASWRRFANSLKLRMAMHCVKWDPQLARKWAEEAVAAGVVTTTAQEIVLNENTMMFSGPFLMLANTWNDNKMGASFISILRCLNHPYLKYLFTNNVRPITDRVTGAVTPADHDIYGVRTGVITENGNGAAYDSNPYLAFSMYREHDFNTDPPFMSAMYSASMYFIKVCEMEFIRAEGALRGWNMGGDAKTFYEQGIRHAQVESRLDSEAQHYVKYVDDYMQTERAVPFTYHDPLNSANDCPAVTTIGVKWNDADDLETKLEKIITQKYIACYPYSSLAWADIRRTGYPKLLPPLNAEDYTDGTYSDPNEIIRRIPLPGGGSSEGDADILDTGIPALEADGGFGDFQYSPVFWDIPSLPNF